MNTIKIVPGLLLLLCAFTNLQSSSEKAATAVAPIDGAWQTVSLTQNGKLSTSKQVKFFTAGFFSLITWDTAGKIAYAGYGKYELEGSSYHETFLYHTNSKYVGGEDWQNYEMKYDTLIMTGFNKVIIGGKDVTAGYAKIVEKRVRLK